MHLLFHTTSLKFVSSHCMLKIPFIFIYHLFFPHNIFPNLIFNALPQEQPKEY